jgi:hypothetical protein
MGVRRRVAVRTLRCRREEGSPAAVNGDPVMRARYARTGAPVNNYFPIEALPTAAEWLRGFMIENEGSISSLLKIEVIQLQH